MNVTQYQAAAFRTAKVFAEPHKNLIHGLLGVITEIGEVATEIKRHYAYGKVLSDDMLKHMREELGDVLWYPALIASTHGKDLGKLLSDVMNQATDLGYTSEVTFGDLQVELPVIVSAGRLHHFDDVEHFVFTSGLAIGALVGSLFPSDAGVELEDSLPMVVSVVALGCKVFGFSMREIAEENVAKLKLRFPDAFSAADAEARADKGGLPALVS